MHHEVTRCQYKLLLVFCHSYTFSFNSSEIYKVASKLCNITVASAAKELAILFNRFDCQLNRLHQPLFSAKNIR